MLGWKVFLVLWLLVTASLGASIPFLKPSFLNLKEDLEDARKEGKYLFIMFHQEGCPFCDRMRRVTFQDKAVGDYFTKHFYMVEVDIRGSNELVDVDGKKMTEKEFARKHDVRLTPVFMFYDQEGKVIAKIPGYIEPRDFLILGRWIVEGHYKNKSFITFLKENRR
ncbi:thioredoxin family protein [Thermocrinis minervae]|uniref:Thioredoxin-related protein n=1 Tax=Thermocrinis minervae TaxID=381751 RepID=A0A1M6QPX7_9AQUI|nr:thioredoxin family protein [Thermocrinis minervae]SHK22256.1 Thioredoxin-related protein [Thermocrinis minervae]